LSGNFNELVKIGVRDLLDEEKHPPCFVTDKGCTLPWQIIDKGCLIPRNIVLDEGYPPFWQITLSNVGSEEAATTTRVPDPEVTIVVREDPLCLHERDVPEDQNSCPTLWWFPPFDTTP